MPITLEIPSKTFTRVGLLVGVPLAILVGAQAVAWAVPEPVPFVTKTTLSSSDLNANFKALADAVTALETKPVVSKNGKTYSLNATFCGQTATSTNGQITGGYAGTKGLCETTCKSASAHMCKGAELVQSVELGVAVPTTEGWYSLGALSYLSGTLGQNASFVSDCVGWTTAGSTPYGTTWSGQTQAAVRSCDTQRPIFCCD